MHISDGVLPFPVVAGTFVLSGALAFWSVRRTRPENIPKTAVMTSAFFVASLIHVPIGPTSVHLLLTGLVGVMLGPTAFLSVLLGLFLQSILFQFGGITTLGANAVMMGIPALLAGWLFQRLKGKTALRHVVAGAISGGLGTAMAAMILALLLMSSGEDFLGVAKIALVAHLPVIVIEGIVSGFTVSFLYRVRPAFLEALSQDPMP